MRILVTGGSASGKSEFAEQKLLSLAGGSPRFYIATMPIFGPEDLARKEKHLRARQGRGFVTVEQPDSLQSLALPDTGEQPRFALLEDIGNLAANEMFGENGISGAEKRAVEGVLSLARQCDTLVAVSVDVSRDGGGYDPETAEYIRIIEHINRALAVGFDEIYEVAAGIAIRIK